ncbi:MAG: HNH endonuclease [Candidatus Cloacimonetes bacterium]|nr:HNH endonuclease [Candidatus Cloacimonadota bacterium]
MKEFNDSKRISINNLIIEYFKKHPKRELDHGPVVDWVEKQYLKLYGKKPRDTWRGIRQLYQKGFLIKVKKGIYMYDPEFVSNRELEEFTEVQKKIILERDDYKCVQCGRGLKEGVELHIDHIKPKDKGGKAIIENGQVLCARCNFKKKNLKQTETGKKMFIRLYEFAEKYNDAELKVFCEYMLNGYEKFNINCHIEWKR